MWRRGENSPTTGEIRPLDRTSSPPQPPPAQACLKFGAQGRTHGASTMSDLRTASALLASARPASRPAERVVIQVNVPADVLDVIDRLAADETISRTAWIRRCLVGASPDPPARP